MFQIFVALSSFCGLVSGVFVLAHGDWRKLQLKYAGVAMSTVCSLLLLIITLLDDRKMSCEADSLSCLFWGVYHLSRNFTFCVFHVAIGRDAIHFKKRERRRCREHQPPCPDIRRSA